MENHIAIGVNDKGEIWAGHFGMAAVYRIYNRQGELLEERENPFGVKPGVRHEHHDDPKRIVKLLHDCKTFIARQMGEKSRRNLVEKQGVETIITKEKNPQTALKNYLL
jgi:predicted Fe-Mo cluster-binding NifX family protein